MENKINNTNLKYFKDTFKLSDLNKLKKIKTNNLEVNYLKISNDIIKAKSTILIKDELEPDSTSNEPNATRLKQRTFYNSDGKLSYIESFNYTSLAESNIVSTLYKPNDKPNEEQDIVYSENSIGYRFYKDGVNNNITEDNYLTYVCNFKNCHNNVILEDIYNNNKNIDYYNSFINELYRNEFKNKEGNEITGKFFKSLLSYQIIQNNIKEIENKQEEIIRNKIKDLTKLDKIKQELNNKINEINILEQQMILEGIDVSSLKNTNKNTTKRSTNSDNNNSVIYKGLFDDSTSSDESSEDINENKYSIRKNLIKERNKLKADKIQEIDKLRNIILKDNNNIKLTEEEKEILNKNNKILYFNNLIEMRESKETNSYFKQLFENYESNNDNKTEYILNELLLNNYIGQDKIIIMPIDLNGHATTMLIDTKEKKPYFFDTSLFHCENDNKVKNEIFNIYSEDIELLNEHSIQLNGCCTYWSASFINLITENKNNKYNTIEQIKEASKTGQLQLDVAIEMCRIFDNDKNNNPTIINNNNIDENNYIKIKIDNNNTYGVNKESFDSKFLKLQGIKEYTEKYLNKEQKQKLDNIIEYQKCIDHEKETFRNKTNELDKQEYTLEDKNILTLDNFINILENNKIQSINRQEENKEQDIENLKKIKQNKNNLQQQMKEELKKEIEE